MIDDKLLILELLEENKKYKKAFEELQEWVDDCYQDTCANIDIYSIGHNDCLEMIKQKINELLEGE
jgi:hypothetical protein